MRRKKVYAFYADSEASCEAWIEAIAQCCGNAGTTSAGASSAPGASAGTDAAS